MPEAGSIAERLQKLRERVGFSVEELAARMDISPFHVELADADFTCEYSPADVQRFCHVLQASPLELFGVEPEAPPLTPGDLAALIRERCSSRGITVEQFEDASGWYVAKSLDDPQRFLGEDYSMDGIQDICRELGVDWRRFLLSL
jgi:hypothetical protein